MWNKVVVILVVFTGFLAHAQLSPEPFAIEMEPYVIQSAPGVHSYSWGQTTDGKWVIVGGRIDGLHQRQPFSAFLEGENNKLVFVIDPIGEQSWFADLSVLPAALFEQMQSTNQQFFQRDTTLYIIGGYGYSATVDDHITYPKLAAIDLNGLANAVIQSQDVTPFFRQIDDVRMKVTGGQLGYLDSTFYLVGGQLFDGRYNPMGPGFGPGFIQEYTDECRSFKLLDDGVNLSITDYLAQNDPANLHRRDYNMVKQIFSNGDIGFTAFSGVFDSNDLPFLNSVDITNGTYTVNNTFNQYLSQYHSAKIPLYDSISQAMHTLFFGGMSQFYFDGTGSLIEDTNVPFVRTISKVTRFSDNSMQEVELSYIQMPALLGSGAEFIPSGDFLIEHEIIDLNAIPNSKTLIGYIYGGIESSAENIFFVNNGTQSFASNTIFKVFINKSIVGMEEILMSNKSVYSDKIFPNPAKNKVTIEYAVPVATDVRIDIVDSAGRIVMQPYSTFSEAGEYSSELDVSSFESGAYVVRLFNGSYQSHFKFIKK